MKSGIHPKYQEVRHASAAPKSDRFHQTDIRVEFAVLPSFLTPDNKRLLNTEGRVDRFVKRYSKQQGKTATAG